MIEAIPRRTLKNVIDLASMHSITSDSLIAMSKDDYQVLRRAATRARLDRNPRYVCAKCGYAVYAPREGRTGQPYWKHHPGAPQACPWWTGTPVSIDLVSAQQFDGAQESPLHAKIKYIVGELLTNDQRTSPESVVVDEYLIRENGRRRPDVRAIYDGVPLVVEVQLATTQIPIIVQREDFYENASIRLLWLTWNFEPPTTGRLLSSFEDIFYSHDKNLFSMDDETISLSKEMREVVLRAFWVDGNEWRSKLVTLFDLNWIQGGRANAVPSTPPWHRDFLSRWRDALGEKGTKWKVREVLFIELIAKVDVACDVEDLHRLDVDALINCMLSLLDGLPVGSRQQNLVEVLNSFLNVDRRQRYVRLIRSFARLTNRDALLEIESVRSKIVKARAVAQDDRQSVSGKIALALFPEVFALATS
ncbi:hypothetical protein JJB99_32695 [Bradyrhizobium diazoefficiens]|uniref:DUF6035 family protein n=1 Tax=Bradyrhizobium diazoefficiens TaxID=1355477 RepID=UPI00190B1859|nr:DUF6035 family protein [Bradyrhizobium diazoefficiens]QQO14022.1 hypothetical protein JJB99_32695 [Bradyrhizobium diazoefficiens]